MDDGEGIGGTTRCAFAMGFLEAGARTAPFFTDVQIPGVHSARSEICMVNYLVVVQRTGKVGCACGALPVQEEGIIFQP
jgi:hypothetical protein